MRKPVEKLAPVYMYSSLLGLLLLRCLKIVLFVNIFKVFLNSRVSLFLYVKHFYNIYLQKKKKIDNLFLLS